MEVSQPLNWGVRSGSPLGNTAFPPLSFLLVTFQVQNNIGAGLEGFFIVINTAFT